MTVLRIQNLAHQVVTQAQQVVTDATKEEQQLTDSVRTLEAEFASSTAEKRVSERPSQRRAAEATVARDAAAHNKSVDPALVALEPKRIPHIFWRASNRDCSSTPPASHKYRRKRVPSRRRVTRLLEGHWEEPCPFSWTGRRGYDTHMRTPDTTFHHARRGRCRRDKDWSHEHGRRPQPLTNSSANVRSHGPAKLRSALALGWKQTAQFISLTKPCTLHVWALWAYKRVVFKAKWSGRIPTSSHTRPEQFGRGRPGQLGVET